MNFKIEDKVKFLGFSNDDSEPEWNKYINKNGIVSWIENTYEDDEIYTGEYPISISFYNESGGFIVSFGVKECEIELIEE